MAKVPDLGSDFAQKLLQDLRRRRERLGFQSSSSGQQQQRTSNTAAPRDSSNSQKPLRSQKPHQGRRPEAAPAHILHQQGSNAIIRAGNPRRRDAPAANAHAIVPFQGGGGSKQKPVANNVDVQMALALALSNSGKLQNIELVAHNGSIFFREPGRVEVRNHRNDYILSPGVHDGGVAIGVQRLNDILMAYSSGAGVGDMGRRSSVDAGKKLFRGSMDLEESLSMLVMLQEASDYMEGSGSGKVLLLKGKENRKSSTMSSPSSARIVEIVDEDSEAEQVKNGKVTSNASMQMVAHNKPQGHSPNSRSVMQLSDVPSNSMINASKGEKDGSKVRVPNVIAKLMGLENLPSTKAVAEHKGTEKFVKSEAVPRKEIRANAMDRKLPIRIVASDRVLSKGLHKDLLAITPYNCEESEGTAALSNSSSHHTTDNPVRKIMKDLLCKMGSTQVGGGEIQGDNERIIHEDRTLAEEIKLQKSVSAGCRSDAGKKMNFLRRFRRNSGNNKPVIEEKHTTQENNGMVGKKQATGIKQLLGRGSETKSRRTREKLKENLATTETNAAGKNGKTAQMKRQAQTKHIDRQSMTKNTQDCREMRNETPSKNSEEKKSVNSEAAHRKPKPAHTVVNDNHTQVNDFGVSKPSDSRGGDGGFPEQFVRAVKDNSTTGVVSQNQCAKQITEEINDPTLADVHRSDDTQSLDQSAIAEINNGRTNLTASETTETLETFTEEEQQQQQQQMIVKEQPSDVLGPTKILSNNPTDWQDHKMHVVSCDSFTETQLLLMKMLLKDQYLLETAKAMVGVHVPVNFVNATACNFSDKRSGLLSDVGREVIRRKDKRTEAMVEVSVARAANPKLQYLGDLIRELGGDIESLNISNKPHRQGDDGTAETLRLILQRDIQNNHPDANSTWDFGWNRISDLPIEKNEVVKDLEKNILGGIITDVARDLIGVSVSHGCCPCQA